MLLLALFPAVIGISLDAEHDSFSTVYRYLRFGYDFGETDLTINAKVKKEKNNNRHNHHHHHNHHLPLPLHQVKHNEACLAWQMFQCIHVSQCFPFPGQISTPQNQHFGSDFGASGLCRWYNSWRQTARWQHGGKGDGNRDRLSISSRPWLVDTASPSCTSERESHEQHPTPRP